MSTSIARAAALATLLAATTPAGAQQAFTEPPPEGWRSALEGLVRQLGATNPPAAVRSARVLRLGADERSPSLLVRFDTPELCDGQRCLTIDMTFSNGGLTTHLAIYAGRMVSAAPGCLGPSLCNGVRFTTDDQRHSLVVFPGPLGPVVY